MGRALFSLQYISSPTICEEQDPAAAPLDVPCERWSAWNQFDPDSEEFFKDAPLEYFVDGPIGTNWGPDGDNVDEAPHVVVLESPAENRISPSTTSSTDNGGTLNIASDSSMVVGADEPATFLAGAYTPVDWQQRFLEAGSEPRRQARPTRNSHRGSRRNGASRQYNSSGDSNQSTHRASSISVFIPPAPHRIPPTPTATSTAQAQEAQQPTTGTPRSSVSRRTVSITPINIPSEPSLPSPISPLTPTTPVSNVIPASANNIITPSPAPNATPRIYSWSRFPGPSASPTRDSPLTNPRARLSLGRIDTMSMSLAQHQYSAPVPLLDRLY